MKLSLRHVLFAVVALPGCVPFACGAEVQSRLLTIENIVQIAIGGTTNWNPAVTNQTLREFDRVRTGERSRATLRLSDLTLLRMQELTVLEIQPQSSAASQPELNLRVGSTYFFSRERPRDVKFKTPLASGAIRGTEFHLAVAANGSTVVTLLDGEIELSNDLGKVALASGDQGIVEPGQPPRRTAVISAINIIQWSLYYPAVLDVDALPWTEQDVQPIAASVAAYRRGNLLRALETYPAERTPQTATEKIYLAALLLSVGQVDAAWQHFPAELQNDSLGLVNAMKRMIAAIKYQEHGLAAPEDNSGGTEWLAHSYYLQSRGELKPALEAARRAVGKAPRFGFAVARLAELEFSFGRIEAAQAALNSALQLTPENAQAISLSGFLLAARDRIESANEKFERAIQIDPALGNAWLGRGLCAMRLGDEESARRWMHVAATVEPQRSLLRSYLGKAFAETGFEYEAERELRLARQLDPNDPTPWLYEALLKQRQNRVNEAARDLEHSTALNDNRRLFRSRLLLDQDRAVRGANLASIYHDARLVDVSVREASRAVHQDYGNASAHLFLANSYAALRDPKLRNLRYETPWLSELLLANLLAPVGAGSLAQSLSQEEYSKLFEQNGLGLFSSSEYFSRGRWRQETAQFGILPNTSYSLDAFYDWDPGQRPNDDSEILSLYTKVKQQLNRQDSLFLQIERHEYTFGDVRQIFDPADPRQYSASLRVQELQEPNLYLGWHREWQPGLHTLFLAGRLHDQLAIRDTNATTRTLNFRNNRLRVEDIARFDWDYETELEAWSSELQQIWDGETVSLIGGLRYQIGESDTRSDLNRPRGLAPPYFSDPPALQQNRTDLERLNFYAYGFWDILDSVQLLGGVSYDTLTYPKNIDVPPITSGEQDEEQISPKVGMVWTPFDRTTLRAVYTRSLGGVFYDQSVRLEPAHLAGFVQAFRSLIPESVVGLVPGSKFETAGIALDQQLFGRTYVGAAAEILFSESERITGAFELRGLRAQPGSTREQLDYTERNLTAYINHLLADEWSIGATYRLSQSELSDRFVEVSPAVRADLHAEVEAVLHHLNAFVLFQHASGFFASAEAHWYRQSNRGYAPPREREDFWHWDATLGYRFSKRRAEIQLALLNVGDQDYRLNPLTVYLDRPRERTLAARFKFQF
ncbi:MAG: TonB-dependent receptor [Verrucomicrobiota bacterium]